MTNSTKSSCPKCGAPIAEDAPQGLCPKCVLAEAATLRERTDSPAGKTSPPKIEEVAPHFPELEILELIGVGGMGAVYKARQTNLDRLVALKILSHDLANDPAFEERFKREARVLARLSHPNIVAIFDTGTAGPYAYFLMEYVDGVNLRQAMHTGGFTPSETLTLVQDVCTALKFAHEEGILHRDIKPENVLLDSRGQVKIADFGIAKLVGQGETDDLTLTMHGAALGSPHYMAPEQFETPGDVDQRADIYSLGVVFYEMLTGELPLGRFALPSEKAAIDARIDDIVLRTLAKEREARFQTAGEVRTEVETFAKTMNTGGNLDTGRNPNRGRTTALVGAWLQLGPVLGLVGTAVVGLLYAFNTVSSGANEELAGPLPHEISYAFTPGVTGFLAGMVGTVLLLVALFAMKYRAKWFYWFMMIYSFLSLFKFPVGTVIGIVCLVYITSRKEEFKTNRAGSDSGFPKQGGSGCLRIAAIAVLIVLGCALAALFLIPEMESRRLWKAIEKEAILGDERPELPGDSVDDNAMGTAPDFPGLDQPLSTLDGVIASMMNTSNDLVFLNLGGIGERENYLSFKPVDGGVTMRFPVHRTFRWSMRQAKYVERIKKAAEPSSLPLEVFPDTDSDGSIEGADYVFTVSGEPGDVSRIIRRVVTETFRIKDTDLCRFQYANMPSTTSGRPGEEPKRVSGDDLVREYDLGTRVYLGESNGKVYLRPATMPLQSPMPWNEEICYAHASDLQPEFLDRLRKGQAAIRTEPK